MPPQMCERKMLDEQKQISVPRGTGVEKIVGSGLQCIITSLYTILGKSMLDSQKLVGFGPLR